MGTQVDREGTFRGEIIEYGSRKVDSGAIAVTIHARLDEIWDGEEWEDWRAYGVEAYGDLYVIKKDGSPNASQVQSLVENAGWDRTFASLSDKTWEPKPCQFVVKQDKDQAGNLKDRWRIAFLNDYDRVPGQLASMSPDEARALDGRFSGQFRAIGGNAQRASSKPAGKPPAPQKAAPKQPRPQPPADESGPDIPF